MNGMQIAHKATLMLISFVASEPRKDCPQFDPQNFAYTCEAISCASEIDAWELIYLGISAKVAHKIIPVRPRFSYPTKLTLVQLIYAYFPHQNGKNEPTAFIIRGFEDQKYYIAGGLQKINYTELTAMISSPLGSGSIK